MSEAREATPQDVQLASDRLKGNGAWNGQGLLTFLALTSRKDSNRKWMEPLKSLCERVLFASEDGVENGLSESEAETFDALAAYSEEFHAAIAVNVE